MYRKTTCALTLLFLGLWAGDLTGRADAAQDRDFVTYVLSVSDMKIGYDVNTDDNWSPEPDLVVRVTRSDPELRAQLGALLAREGGLESRRRALGDERGKLNRRADGTEPPLTSVQSERLAAVSVEVGGFCTESERACERCPTSADFETCYKCAKCPELDLLKWRNAESAPLTAAEEQRMRELGDLVSGVAAELAESERRSREIRSRLSGSTVKVTTSSKVVHFGDTPVINVHPGDEVDVSVWDDDVFNDDLYGRKTLVLEHETLEQGTLVIQLDNIDYLRLTFRPLGDDN